MANPQATPDTLNIRCPSCGQKFKVGPELRDRLVECGACEKQFRVNDETIVHTKKFYPGERRDPLLDGFARHPLSAPMPAKIQTAHYAPEPRPQAYEPVGPQRVIAGVIAVVMMLMVALLLVFGASHGRALDGMSTPNRLILAGFIGILGGCMLVYANPRGRKKAAMVAVLFLAGLLSLPLMFREGSEPLPEGGRAGASPEAAGKPADDEAEKIRLMRLGPLKEENARLAAKGASAGRAVGLWLRGMKESNKLVVRDHLVRETGADPDSNLYVRDQGDWLMVLSGVKLPLEQISAIVGKLGRDGQAERVYPELGVVEVRVDNDAFVESPIDKLSDRSNPAFYELNKRELDSIDLDRARRAVKRLADAEPKIFREDIVRRLSQLLKDANAADAGLICQALAKWSTPEQGFATTAAADALRRLHGQGAIIGRDMVAFLISRKETSVASVIDDLWAADRTAWEQLYGELGPAIEPFVLEHLDGGSSILRQSAVRLLGRVGTAKSLPKLQELRGSADAELRVLLERAENSIRQREGQGAR